MKPPFPYFGSKSTIASEIVRLLPAHEHYVEPYAGSLAVLLAKRPSRMETVNDLDGHLVTFWRMLRDRPIDLARVCALTPHARAEHAASYDLGDPVDELEAARRVWVQLTQARSGQRRRIGWRHYVNPAGSASMPRYLQGYVDRMASATERLIGVSLECRPALELIARYGQEPKVLLYVDPPYLGSTRDGGNNYVHEMKDDLAHRELAEALVDCRSAVVVSGYASDLYDLELFVDWYRHEIAATCGNGIDRARTEVLWSNRPLNAQAELFAVADVADGSAGVA